MVYEDYLFKHFAGDGAGTFAAGLYFKHRKTGEGRKTFQGFLYAGRA